MFYSVSISTDAVLIAMLTRYIVAFRSKRRPDANTEWLYAADREAHEEAVTAGGLLLYWSVSSACVGYHA